MNAFGFRADEKLTQVLKRTPFTLSAEIIPPRNGLEQRQVLDQIGQLVQAGAQFLAVTKGAGGSLRGGSLPIAQAIKETYNVPCIAHFTCRDLTPEEVENQLMDHHYFGIRNILGLRGDPPEGRSDWHPKAGSHQYAYQLIAQIQALNEGKYLSRPGSKAPAAPVEKTDFCIGAAVYPEHANEREGVEFYKLKVDAGAEYGITQMIFDADAFARYSDRCAAAGIRAPILPGTRILKTRGMAQRVAARFGVSVPKEWINRLPDGDSPAELQQAVEVFLDFVARLKALGAPGAHVFVISDTAGSCAALRALGGR